MEGENQTLRTGGKAGERGRGGRGKRREMHHIARDKRGRLEVQCAYRRKRSNGGGRGREGGRRWEKESGGGGGGGNYTTLFFTCLFSLRHWFCPHLSLSLSRGRGRCQIYQQYDTRAVCLHVMWVVLFYVAVKMQLNGRFSRGTASAGIEVGTARLTLCFFDTLRRDGVRTGLEGCACSRGGAAGVTLLMCEVRHCFCLVRRYERKPHLETQDDLYILRSMYIFIFLSKKKESLRQLLQALG